MTNKNYFIKGIINIIIYFYIIFLFDCIYKTTKSIFISQLPIIILLVLLFFKYKKQIIKDIKSFKLKYIKKILLYLIIEFILVIISNYIINYVLLNKPSPNELENELLLLKNIIPYSIQVIILIPIIEEISYRVEFKKINNYKIYIVTSSILFALSHMTIINNIYEIIYITPYLIMGYTFSKIYYKTNNIFTNILLHSLHNLLTVFILIIMKGLL